jgi:hypothetical protein
LDKVFAESVGRFAAINCRSADTSQFPREICKLIAENRGLKYPWVNYRSRVANPKD